MPLPMYTPTCSAFSGVHLQPGVLHGAFRGRDGELNEAPHLLDFFFLDVAGRIETLTSPAMRQEKAVASNCVIGPMPLSPAQNAFQVASVPMPSGVSKPTPVTTTLRDNEYSLGKTRRRYFFLLVFDVVDGVFHGGYLLGVLVRDLQFEGFFKGHDQLDDIERIGAQVVHERRVVVHLGFVHAQLLDDNLLHPLGDRCHTSSWTIRNS